MHIATPEHARFSQTDAVAKWPIAGQERTMMVCQKPTFAVLNNEVTFRRVPAGRRLSG